MSTLSLRTLVDFSANADPMAAVLVKVTALLAIAWVTHAMLVRSNPRWRVLLWRTVAVGLLLVPFFHAVTPPMQFSLSPQAITVSETTNRTAGDNTDSASNASTEPIVVLPPAGEDVFAHEPAFASTARQWPISLRNALIGVWIVGFFVCILRIFAGLIYVRKLIERSTDAPAVVQAQFESVRSELVGGQPVALRVSSEIATPILCCISRPKVLIPSGLSDPAREGHLPAVFAHELAHVRTHDLLWNLALHVSSSVLWFHPLGWFVRAAHAASCESVSDAVATNHVGSVKQYCRTLAQVALDAVHKPPMISAAMARTSNIVCRTSALHRRVFDRKLSAVIATIAVLVCLMVTGALGGFGVALADEPSQNAQKLMPAEEVTAIADQAGGTVPVESDADDSERESEERSAAEKGLKYLASKQHRDGSFGGGAKSSVPAFTSLCAMAMLSSGSKPGTKPDAGPYGLHLEEARKYLLRNVHEDGFIGIKESRGTIYVHAYALRFLALAQLANASAEAQPVIDKAVKLMVDCQSGLGGWRYSTKSKDSDTSVTSCVLIALATAKQAGANVPQKTIDRALEYLGSCQVEDGGFGYVSNHPGMGSARPRSAAVVSAFCLAGLVDDEHTKKGLAYLDSSNDPTKNIIKSAHYFYSIYHLATAMHFAGDQRFSSWYDQIKKYLLSNQKGDGSWMKDHYQPEYSTAAACIVLLSPDKVLVQTPKANKK